MTLMIMEDLLAYGFHRGSRGMQHGQVGTKLLRRSQESSLYPPIERRGHTGKRHESSISPRTTNQSRFPTRMKTSTSFWMPSTRLL